MEPFEAIMFAFAMFVIMCIVLFTCKIKCADRCNPAIAEKGPLKASEMKFDYRTV